MALRERARRFFVGVSDTALRLACLCGSDPRAIEIERQQQERESAARAAPAAEADDFSELITATQLHSVWSVGGWSRRQCGFTRN